MAPYIDFNTTQRAKAKYDYEKDLFKLMNNAVFGKTLENVRQRTPFELVNSEKRFQKLVNDPLFDGCVVINDSLCGITRKRATVLMPRMLQQDLIGKQWCRLRLSPRLLRGHFVITRLGML
jgi:hypothetical protein